MGYSDPTIEKNWQQKEYPVGRIVMALNQESVLEQGKVIGYDEDRGATMGIRVQFDSASIISIGNEFLGEGGNSEIVHSPGWQPKMTLEQARQTAQRDTRFNMS